MAAPVTSSEDSSSSDEEENQRLKEAAIPFNNTPSIKGNCSMSPRNSQYEKKIKADILKPSLRLQVLGDFNDDKELDTTPEFKNHVARKLSETLNRSLSEVDKDVPEIMPVTDGDDNAFKLFTSSQLKNSIQDVKAEIKKRTVSSSSSESDDRFASVAVSARTILQDTDFDKYTKKENEEKIEHIIIPGKNGKTSQNLIKEMQSKTCDMAKQTVIKKKKKKKKKVKHADETL